MKKRFKILLVIISVAVLFSFLIPLNSLFACEEPPPPPPDEEVCVEVDLDVETDAQQTLEVTKEIELMVEDKCEEQGEGTEESTIQEEERTEEEACDVIELEEGKGMDIVETIIVEVVDPVDFVTYFIDVNTVVKNEHNRNIVFVDDVVVSVFMEYTDNPGFWLLVEEIPVYTDERFDGVPGNGDDIILAGQEKTYSVHREYYYLYGSIINWKAESVVFNHVFEPEGCRIVRVDAINEGQDSEESPRAEAPAPIDIIDKEYFEPECQDVASFEITATSEIPDYIEEDGKTAEVHFYGVTGPKEIKIWKTIYGVGPGNIRMRNDVTSSLNNWEKPVASADVCIEVTSKQKPEPKPEPEPKEDISTVAAAPVQTVVEQTPVAELPYTGASPIIPLAGLGLVLSGLGGVITSVIRRKKQ